MVDAIHEALQRITSASSQAKLIKIGTHAVQTAHARSSLSPYRIFRVFVRRLKGSDIMTVSQAVQAGPGQVIHQKRASYEN